MYKMLQSVRNTPKCDSGCGGVAVHNGVAHMAQLAFLNSFGLFGKLGAVWWQQF